MKAEIQKKRYIILQESVLNLRLIATKLASLLAHACKVRDVNVQDNSSNGNRDTEEKVYYSPRKCP